MSEAWNFYRSIEIPNFPAHKWPSQHYPWVSLTHADSLCKGFQQEKLSGNKVAPNKWYQEYVLAGWCNKEVKSCNGWLLSVVSVIFVPQHVLVLWRSIPLMPVFTSWEQKQGCIKEFLSAPSLSGWRSVLVAGGIHPQGEHPHWGSAPSPETEVESQAQRCFLVKVNRFPTFPH